MADDPFGKFDPDWTGESKQFPIPLTPAEVAEVDAYAKARGQSRQWVLENLYLWSREREELPEVESRVKPVQVVFRMPEKALAKLLKEAEAKGHTQGGAVSYFIRESLRRLRDPKPKK